MNAGLVTTGEKKELASIKIRNGKIISVRKQRNFIPTEDGNQAFDALGKIVLPGLIDHHSHPFALGAGKRALDLRGCSSIKELQDRLRQHSRSPHGHGRQSAIIGRGWDQDLFEEKRYPSRLDLDSAVSDVPVFLERICGHVAVLNTLALERIHISKKNFDEKYSPKLPDGSPSGLIRENALDFVRASVPPVSAAQLQEDFLFAQQEALSKGLVGLHCICSENWRRELNALRKLEARGQLRIFVSALLPVSAIPDLEELAGNEIKKFCEGTRLGVIGFKLFADGSLGARTAALLKPYGDDPSTSGILLADSAEIEKLARRAKKLKMILATHAIGDRAVDRVIDGYRKARVRKSDGFRIEHCSIIPNKSLRHLSPYTISVQPSFITSDYWIKDRLGEGRESTPYPLKSIARISRMVGGSDSPVEDISPLAGICAAMSNPIASESLSLLNAIRIYSEGNGLLSPNLQANFTVLDTDDVDGICEAKVEAVIINGCPEFSRS